MRGKLSEAQRGTLAAVHRAHENGQWFRARSGGERVTLASLYRYGLLTRRVWRAGKQEADNAHEYKLSDAFVEEWKRKIELSRSS
jgi:hypothetical protein